MAGVPEHFNLPWHVGIESGELEALNLEVEFVTFPGGTGAMMQAVAESEVDLAVVLTEGCIQSICGGSPAKIIKVFVDSPLIWGIHVPADSDLHRIDQIRGRRYAISRFGSGSHLMAIVDAAQRGWATELEFVVVKNLDGARRALAGGEADVFFWERYTTSPMVESGKFRRLDDRLTPWPAFVICANQQSLTYKQDAIRVLLDQVNAICRRLICDADPTQQIIADRYEIDLKKIQQWWQTTRWNTDWTIQRDPFLDAIDHLRRLNLIQTDDSASNEKLFTQIFAPAAR